MKREMCLDKIFDVGFKNKKYASNRLKIIVPTVNLVRTSLKIEYPQTLSFIYGIIPSINTIFQRIQNHFVLSTYGILRRGNKNRGKFCASISAL